MYTYPAYTCTPEPAEKHVAKHIQAVRVTSKGKSHIRRLRVTSALRPASSAKYPELRLHMRRGGDGKEPLSKFDDLYGRLVCENEHGASTRRSFSGNPFVDFEWIFARPGLEKRRGLST